MDRAALDTLGYCRAGTLETAWPDGPDEPVRDVLSTPGWARELANCSTLTNIASIALGAEAHPVRANLFVKSNESNWCVPWHQDRVVCVRKREDVAGFSGWSVKAGLPHANAPIDVLRQIVAIRIHLDSCSAQSGPLEVVPGSHAEVLSPDQIASVTDHAVQLSAETGEALVMRPLLLHRSMAMKVPAVRRVLHVEFASAPLPTPLQWHYW